MEKSLMEQQLPVGSDGTSRPDLIGAIHSCFPATPWPFAFGCNVTRKVVFFGSRSLRGLRTPYCR